MKNPSREIQAFTLIELLVVISIIVILATLMLPHLRSFFLKGQMVQTLNNERQLYLATHAMAIDGATTTAANNVWPGDLANPSFSAWASSLCAGYLSTNDFCKLCSAPGVVLPTDQIPANAAATAFKIYAVQESSDGNAVFMITRNATLHGRGTNVSFTLDSSIKPYGNQGCVIIHRGGDAVMLLQNQSNNASAIGGLAPNAVLLE